MEIAAGIELLANRLGQCLGLEIVAMQRPALIVNHTLFYNGRTHFAARNRGQVGLFKLVVIPPGNRPAVFHGLRYFPGRHVHREIVHLLEPAVGVARRPDQHDEYRAGPYAANGSPPDRHDIWFSVRARTHQQKPVLPHSLDRLGKVIRKTHLYLVHFDVTS